LLQVEKLSRRFGGVQALTDVSFSVATGERLAIIGPNGAGKTTLFNCLTGAPPPSGGRVLFGGEDVTMMAPNARADRGVARSFQTISPFGKLTVEETALIAVNGRGSSRYGVLRRLRGLREQTVEAHALIERAGLAEQAEEKLERLSYGEQRRLDLALTLVGEPRLFLLDEPSAGLTSAESEAIVGMVRSLPQEVAVVIIDHDMDVVFKLAERILVLHHGRVIAVGSREEIKEDATVRDVYLGGGLAVA
jgi:ABC-type branched-subunit amino acid transport system ATPase component